MKSKIINLYKILRHNVAKKNVLSRAKNTLSFLKKMYVSKKFDIWKNSALFTFIDSIVCKKIILCILSVF